MPGDWPAFKIGFRSMRGVRKRSRSMRRKAFRFPVAVANSPAPTVLETPIKSEADKKSYRVIRLPNGLTALLISDPSPRHHPDNPDNPDNPDKPDSGAKGKGKGKAKGKKEEEEEDVEEEEETETESESEAESDCIDSPSTNASKVHTAKFQNKLSSASKMYVVKSAACALSVGVGSFSDPPNIMGMAHFVEHMLFMGSAKYPGENEFDSFIKRRGGEDNAHTTCDMTTFCFEIQENHLSEAMDRFSRFFVSPLMKPEAMKRERRSIESEFSLALPEEPHRRDQLLYSTLPVGHPGRSFSWGNNRSLTPPIGPSNKKLHTAAHDFRHRHYSAHRMTVAIQARYPLDTLEKFAIAAFSDIPTNKLPADDFSQYAFNPSVVTRDFNALYYVKPVSETSNVTLTWCMRSFLKEYKTKPHHYVSWIIGNDGAGSLLLYLKRKVWALNIATGIPEGGMESSSLMCLFSMTIELTQDGMSNIDKVLDSVFSYVNMMKSCCPSRRIFDELRRIDEINFKFKDEPPSYDNVEQLSENMQNFPPQHYITGHDILYEYDPDAIMYVVNSMCPTKVNVMLQSQDYPEPIQYDQVEEWFGTEYKKVELLKSTIDRWKKIPPQKEFHLPQVNRFIPDHFDLIPYPEELIEANKKASNDTVRSKEGKADANNSNVGAEVDGSRGKAPKNEGDTKDLLKVKEVDLKLIRNDRLMEVWFKPDYNFDLPYTFVYMYFITPLATESVKTTCMMDLWCAILIQILTEELFAADVVGGTRSLTIEEKGIMLKLSGFSQTIPTIIDLITQVLSNYSNSLTLEWFDAIKDMHAKSYYNVVMKPSKLVKEVRLSVLMVSDTTILEKLKTLSSVTLEDMKGFGKRFKEKLYIQMLMQGNLLKEDVYNIVNTIHKNLNWKPMVEKEMPRVLVYRMPLGEKHCRVASFNSDDVNSIITNYYQYGVWDVRNCCIVELLISLMEEPLFNTLRTREQLGYMVFCTMRYTSGILGFSITVGVQAAKYTTGYVDSRIEAFIRDFFKTMKNMSAKEFKQSKLSLIKIKSRIDVELEEEVCRNWDEITTSEYQFYKRQLEIECLKSLTKEEVLAWWNNYVKSDENQRRKLSVQIVGYKPLLESELNEHVNKKGKKVTIGQQHDYPIQYLDVDEHPNDCIKNIAEFKKLLRVFPDKDGSFDFGQLCS